MARGILVRFTHAVLSVLVLLTLVFFLVRVSGDPAYSLISPDAPRELRDRLRAEWGVDRPLADQYVIYLKNVVTGNLGTSFRSRVPVTDMVLLRLPATLTMGLCAFGLTLLFGLPLGIYAAYWRGGKVDRLSRLTSAVGQSVPSFWLGLLLILVFAIWFGLLPSGGFGRPENLVLPAVTLALGPIAGLTRLLRSSMIETLGNDYILFNRAKGLPERSILWKHALRNAGLTTLGFLGVLIAGLFTGSVLVETVFIWPGIGRLMIEGIQYRDYPVVQGVMMFYAVAYIAANLVVDVLYTVLNPRLR